MTSVAKRPAPARHAGAEAYPGQPTARPRPGAAHGPRARPRAVRPQKESGRVSARVVLAAAGAWSALSQTSLTLSICPYPIRDVPQ